MYSYLYLILNCGLICIFYIILWICIVYMIVLILNFLLRIVYVEINDVKK